MSEAKVLHDGPFFRITRFVECQFARSLNGVIELVALFDVDLGYVTIRNCRLRRCPDGHLFVSEPGRSGFPVQFSKRFAARLGGLAVRALDSGEWPKATVDPSLPVKIRDQVLDVGGGVAAHGAAALTGGQGAKTCSPISDNIFSPEANDAEHALADVAFISGPTEYPAARLEP